MALLAMVMRVVNGQTDDMALVFSDLYKLYRQHLILTFLLSPQHSTVGELG